MPNFIVIDQTEASIYIDSLYRDQICYDFYDIIHIFFSTKYRNTIIANYQGIVDLSIWFEFKLDIAKRS